jgi:hypothetical protein
MRSDQRRLVGGSLALSLLVVAPPTRADDTPTFADRSDEEVRDADRSWGLLLNPLATAVGVYGGEADFVFARIAALAIEGDVYRRGEGTELAVGMGLLLYPLGRAFQRLYFEPRVVYVRPLSMPLPDFDWGKDVFGLGATAGWQWTWDYGFSLRIGGGAMYYVTSAQSVASSAALLRGPQVVLDGSVGWTF